jgi:4-hydroxy-2,2'-bipyrrole-5-carbaldehyde O-methyltransferase
MLAPMATWVGTTAQAVGRLVARPHRVGRTGVLRDMDRWLRLQFLGAASQAGVARALTRGRASAAEVAERADLAHVELVEALLRVGVALGEVRERRGRYGIKGRRLRAVADPDRADDVGGLVEEIVGYDGPVYRHLDRHLRGEPVADYLDGVQDAVARASRLVEPLVGPFLGQLTRAIMPESALDVGCGTGVNMRWIAGADPGVRVTGIDAEAGVVERARRWLRQDGVDGVDDRCEVRHSRFPDLPADLRGPYDLVLLAQNVCYWPPDRRSEAMRQARELLTERGTLAVVTAATPARLPFVRHLDLALRVTQGTFRLPTTDELRDDASAAGFGEPEVRTLTPGTGMVALVARQSLNSS